MASPLVKPLAFTALAGASGTGGYFGSKLLTSKNSHVQESKKKPVSVAELLSKHTTKQLLDKSLTKTHSDWTTAWSNYKTKNNDSDPLKIGNWSTKKTQAEVPEEFLNRCDEESKKEVLDTSDPIYVNVLNWCTKDKEAAKAPSAGSV
ncbi:hypothetical protein HF1_11990 [Mycoplasma haemofelis str. Langford 1]|uniref:Uncharacterized protein n=1 Tax=Mycoplasma haemofelis (strain Langford 1) TaxID=941640 RepID=E8ZJ86_MYCHL|nr:hypothetical protein [Mycoplasma haemofelis]CBY93207.1 hypothetical protein HF1_11990 [Mycoplasma haemofelis str. Langford 1]